LAAKEESMKSFILFLCFLVASPVFAKAKHAPLPDAVLNAKSVYILNDTGMQKIADTAYEDLTKWGRFSIAPNRKSADLIIHFVGRDVLLEGTSKTEVSMYVTTPDSDDPLFQDTSRPHFSWAAVVHSNISAFRKWVEGN